MYAFACGPAVKAVITFMAMATRKRSSRKSADRELESEMRQEMVTPVPSPEWPEAKLATPRASRKMVGWVVVGLLILAIVGFWYKTSSWPIAAIVNGRPITRFEVNRELYKQNGETMLEGMITERLVRGEIARLKLTVSDVEIDAKLEEIKKTLGEEANLEDVLAERGLTMADARKQLWLQMAMEKAVAGDASVSAEEIDAYIATNGIYLSGTDEEKRKAAETSLIQRKGQEAITAWIDAVRARGKVWKM